jgi:hypothetical protein
MSPDDIFAGIDDLYYRGSRDCYVQDHSAVKEAHVRYYPDRHFEPVTEEGPPWPLPVVRSFIMRVAHPYHQGWTIDLIAWPTCGKRVDKWATRFKRAGLFAIRRLAPAFNGGSDPFFVHRTPHHLLRSERPDLERHIDRAYGAVLLGTDADRQLDQVRTIIAEDEGHASALAERFGRPVRYLPDDSDYIGADRDIEWWLKHHTVTVNP